jgi:hypothetical protein
MSTNGFFCDNDLRVEDFDDEETADCRVPVPLVARGVGGRPLTEDEATVSARIGVSFLKSFSPKSLKELVFGSNPLCEEWRQQYLEFSPNVFYGLVQRKVRKSVSVASSLTSHWPKGRSVRSVGRHSGAPSRAPLLLRTRRRRPPVSRQSHGRHLVARGRPEARVRRSVRISRQNLLSRALFRSESRETSSRALPLDGICERLVVATLDDYDALWRHIAALLDHNARALGVLSFLFSALLTRDARQDMDDVSSRLIGRHNYCTQEMVNLLLTGRAVSNVFDNTRRLSPELLLRGIARQSRIGFLSLFEHFGCLEVRHDVIT